MDFFPTATTNNNSDKSDAEIVTRKRLSDLTIITENLRKDLKQMNNVVNDLLPEVRSLTEGLQKHQTHLMALTQLMTGSSYHDGSYIYIHINISISIERERREY